MMRRWSVVVAVCGVAMGACGGARQVAPATCGDAAQGAANSLRAVRPSLVEAKLDPAPELAALCTADVWTDESRRCFVAASTPKQTRVCAAQLTEPQRVHARAVQTDFIARAATTAPEPPAVTGIAECNEYVAAIDALVQCPNVPRHIRDAMLQTKAAVSSTWANLVSETDPSYAEARAAIATHCDLAREGLLQSAQALGC